MREQFVLASASPRRRELLASLGVPFTVRAADVPEPLVADVPPAAQAEALALAKARAVAADGAAVVLGADTIVVLDDRPLGKPADAREARAMLRGLRARPHEVVTGLAVVAPDGTVRTAHAATQVHMRAYDDDEIEAYIASGDPFDKAGAYAIQHPDFRPVARVEGCYCNVIGLPLWTARRLLAATAPGLATRPPDRTWQRCAACPLADGRDA
jgi:septum formation protein